MAKLFANNGDLLRCHILWHLIWVCTVCQLSFYGYPDYNGLRETSLPKLMFLPFEKGSPLKGKFAPPWEQILSLKRISFSEGSWWKGNRKSQKLSPLLKVGGKFNRFFLSDRTRVERKTMVTQTYFLKPLFRGNLDPFVNNANLGAIAHTSIGT